MLGWRNAVSTGFLADQIVWREPFRYSKAFRDSVAALLVGKMRRGISVRFKKIVKYLVVLFKGDSKMVTVQIFSQSTGKPMKGTGVDVSEVGFFHGMTHSETDNNGEAHFANLSPGEVEIYVNGNTLFKGRLEGRKVIYI